MFRLVIDFCRIGIFIAQNITSKLNGHALHTQTDTERRDTLFACIAQSGQFSLNASRAEAGSHYDTIALPQYAIGIFCLKSFALHKR